MQRKIFRTGSVRTRTQCAQFKIQISSSYFVLAVPPLGWETLYAELLQQVIEDFPPALHWKSTVDFLKSICYLPNCY